MEYFKPYIENIPTYAIGPYYWLVPDNSTMRMIAASENMSQLTPYRNFNLANWKINSIEAFSAMILSRRQGLRALRNSICFRKSRKHDS